MGWGGGGVENSELKPLSDARVFANLLPECRLQFGSKSLSSGLLLLLRFSSAFRAVAVCPMFSYSPVSVEIL